MDSGYAWVILVTCFLCVGLGNGFRPVFGILYTDILERYQAGQYLTSWIITIQVLHWGLMGKGVVFFLKFLVDTCPCWGQLVPLYWISCFKPEWVLPYLLFFFVERNVIQISSDPPLVLHMPTSWWPASQLVTTPHASAKVRLGSDSNGQSTGQKTIAC